MIKKLVGVVGIASVFALVAGVGCSATVTRVGTDGGDTPTAEAGPIPGVDGGKPPKSDGGPVEACYAEDGLLEINGIAPTKSSGKCSPSQLIDVDAKCISDTTATDADCQAYIAANENCARCVFGALDGDTEATVPMPALITVSEEGAILPNVYACAALVIGKPDCALKLTKQEVCLESACGLCEGDDGYSACRTEAATKACKDVMDATCTKAVEDAETQWTALCDGKDFDEAFKKVGTYMCGGASVDAGGD